MNDFTQRKETKMGEETTNYKYAVIYLNINDGTVENVFKTEEVIAVGEAADQYYDLKKMTLDDEREIAKGIVIDIDSLMHWKTFFSPGCRNIRHGGQLWRVCP